MTECLVCGAEMASESPKLGVTAYECPACDAGWVRVWEGGLERVGGPPPARPSYWKRATREEG